jgi:hypothetical protein
MYFLRYAVYSNLLMTTPVDSAKTRMSGPPEASLSPPPPTQFQAPQTSGWALVEKSLDEFDKREIGDFKEDIDTLLVFVSVAMNYFLHQRLHHGLTQIPAAVGRSILCRSYGFRPRVLSSASTGPQLGYCTTLTSHRKQYRGIHDTRRTAGEFHRQCFGSLSPVPALTCRNSCQCTLVRKSCHQFIGSLSWYISQAMASGIYGVRLVFSSGPASHSPFPPQWARGLESL